MAHIIPWFPPTMTREHASGEATRELKKLYPVGTEVPMSVVHVSRNGMSKTVKVYALVNRTVVNVSDKVALALGRKFDNTHNGVVIGGNIDPVEHIRYALSLELHRNSRAGRVRERGTGCALKAYRI